MRLCMSVQVIAVVKGLTKTGITICATIHNPTPYCFNLFDRLMILLHGRVVYSGENGDLPALGLLLAVCTYHASYCALGYYLMCLCNILGELFWMLEQQCCCLAATRCVNNPGPESYLEAQSVPVPDKDDMVQACTPSGILRPSQTWSPLAGGKATATRQSGSWT